MEFSSIRAARIQMNVFLWKCMKRFQIAAIFFSVILSNIHQIGINQVKETFLPSLSL